MISGIIRQIQGLISEVAALQKAHVEMICPACEAPCCFRVHYLFNKEDILFLRLSGQELRWDREAVQTKGCWFLGPGGCLLAPESRPFICLRYICPDLETEMHKKAPDLMNSLLKRFAAIDALRSRMWAEYRDTATAPPHNPDLPCL